MKIGSEIEVRMVIGRWFHSPGAAKENDLDAADWRDLLLGLFSARRVLSDAERSPALVWMWKEKQDERYAGQVHLSIYTHAPIFWIECALSPGANEAFWEKELHDHV